MCFARLLTKIFKEEDFNETDWNDVAEITCATLAWLYENSSIVHTPETNQVHFQPKRSSKRKKTKRRDEKS
jgi:hypothetical protein